MKESITEYLYAYLKDKYGIHNTEIVDATSLDITKSIKVNIPGIRRNREEHDWVIFIEKGEDNKKSLIIGEHWPDEHTSWSRCFEVEDHRSENYSFPFLKFIKTMHFKKDEDFGTLIIFLNIFKEFFKTIS